MSLSITGCTRCRARKTPLPRCPYCGTLGTEIQLASKESTERYYGVVAEEEMQRRYLTWAAPVVFVLGALLMSGGGSGFVRIVFGMWLHEFGHAISAWMTGFWAVPGPWLTTTALERSLTVTLTLLGLFGYVGYRGWAQERRSILVCACILGALTLYGTFGVSIQTAQTASVFFGDGGMMILGCIMVLTFWAPVGTHLHTSMLRWGFLVIGAFAILDGIFTWWPARKDPSVIPYGKIINSGGELETDATKLIDVSHWPQEQMIGRYVWVIYIVVAIIIARWAWGMWTIHKEREGRL